MSLRRATYIAAKSEKLIDRIRSYGAKCPVQLNYWGSDLELFSPGDKAAARTELNLPPDRPIILSARAIEPRLNIDLIIDAISMVSKKIPDSMLVMIGRSGP